MQIGGRRVPSDHIQFAGLRLVELGRQELGCKVKVNNTVFMGSRGRGGWDGAVGRGCKECQAHTLERPVMESKAHTQLKDAKLPNCSTKRHWTCW